MQKQLKNQLRLILTIIIAGLLGVTTSKSQIATGGNYTLDQSVIASGGGASRDASDVYKIEGTIGQSVVGANLSGRGYYLNGGFWTPGPSLLLAANIQISGRILTADGRGIRGVIITLITADGTLQTAVSSSFGYYAFDNVPSGTNCVVSVRARKYRFENTDRVLSTGDNLSDVDFVANPL